MVSSVRLMALLAGKAQNLEFSGRSTAGDSIRPEDVAGALAGLPKGPYLLGRLVFAQDNDVSGQTVSLVALVTAGYFRDRGWKTDHCRRIAEMLLFEILAPRHCPDCSTEGFRWVPNNGQVAGGPWVKQYCERCHGKGRIEFSQRKAAKQLGMDHRSYARDWAPRVMPIRRVLNDWENRCLRQIKDQLLRNDEAA